MRSKLLFVTRWTTEQKTALGFAAAVILVFAIGIIAYLEVNRFIETNKLVSHTLDVLKEIEASLSAITTGEAQQRAYIITGDETYLESYNIAKVNAENRISNLQFLTVDNPIQRERLDKLNIVVPYRFSLLQEGIDTYQEQGFAAAQALISAGEGRSQMLNIRTIMDDMRETENALLRERSGFSENSAQISRLTLVVLMGSAFGLITIIYVLIRNDITGRKNNARALTYERDLLQSVMDNIPDNIYIKDRASRFIRINAASARFFGLASVEDAIGKTDFDFQQADLAKTFFDEEQSIIQSGQAITDRYEFNRDASGDERWLSATKAPIFRSDGQVSGIVGISRDITNRKVAEDEIKKLNEHLKRQSAELEASNKELEAFSYSVSHDLRTPLRAIDGFSQALLEDYGDKLDSDGQSYLQRVRAASQRMAELIDDLLDLSRVTRAEMRQESINLSLLAQQIVNGLRKADGTRAVSFTAAENLKATGDSHLLRVALENLLGNAWKFTQKQANAEIEFGATVREDGQTAYYIRDNGAGFDMHYASKLFGAFQRLHAANDFPGTGIGLATVQRIIHRHGGIIWAEGAVDQGATFYFTL